MATVVGGLVNPKRIHARFGVQEPHRISPSLSEEPPIRLARLRLHDRVQPPPIRIVDVVVRRYDVQSPARTTASGDIASATTEAELNRAPHPRKRWTHRGSESILASRVPQWLNC